MKIITDVFGFFGDVLYILFIVVCLYGIVILPIIGLITFWEYKTCQTLQQIHETYEFDWMLFGGCRVKTPDGYWIDYDDFKFVETNIESE